MKIYLAGRVSKRPILQKWATALESMGHTVVSRWSKVVVTSEGLSDRAADDERERFAREDIEDINRCECVLSLMENPREGRGGRHVEFGYAMALGKRLAIIGERETVFHHLPEVEHYETFQAFLDNGINNPKPNVPNSIIHRMQLIQEQAQKEIAESLKLVVGLCLISSRIDKLLIDPTAINDFNANYEVFTRTNEDGLLVYRIAERESIH